MVATESQLRQKKILVICPHPEGVAPGQRLKYEQYFDFLRRNGFDIEISPFIDKRFHGYIYKKKYYLLKIICVVWGYLKRIFDLLRLRSFDGVYIFLWVTPFGPPIFEFLYRCLARKMIYDIDDLVYMGHSSAANRYISFLKGRKKPLYLMQNADHVITCTPHLDSIARKYTQRTTDISSTINTETYTVTNPYSNDRTITLGWSGSITTAPYLHLLDEVLRELSQRRKFNLLVIGDANFSIPGVNVEALAWRSETEVRDLSRIDIGLYPLPNDPWVYGKSGLKALQYMALGIPPVAQAIGANFRVIEDGVTGFLVNTKEEWITRIESLMDLPDLRKKLGARAREKVVNEFSVKANQPVYLKIFQETYR